MPLLQRVRPVLKTMVVRGGLFRLSSKTGKYSAAILRYHSVLPRPEEFSESIGAGIIHSTDAFSAQMELLSKRYHPVTLDVIGAFLKGEAILPPRSVAVTFDDGFADNLDHAAPILARTGVPATVYLAADYIGNLKQPWYCRLRYAFATSAVPTWRVNDDTQFDLSIPEQRHQAFIDLSKQCAQLCGSVLDEFLTQIETRLDVESFSIPVMLTWQGARELLKQGHIIGSHTLSHPNVAYIQDQQLKHELVSSKRKIEKNIDSTVQHFSYPSPILEPHHSPATLAAAERAGYETAVTCDKGTIRKGDNSLSLRRIYVPPTAWELEWALENGFVGRYV